MVSSPPTSGLLKLQSESDLDRCRTVVQSMVRELNFSASSAETLLLATDGVACNFLFQRGGGRVAWEMRFREPTEFGIRLIFGSNLRVAANSGRKGRRLTDNPVELPIPMVDEVSIRSLLGGRVKVVMTQWAGCR